MVNSKDVKVGQVLYFLERSGYNYSYVIDFGVVEEIWHDKIVLVRYTNKDTRLVNGIPYNKFITPTRWQKLPKGWTYNTILFEITYSKIEEDAKKYRIDNPDDIKAAIDKGYLVKCIDYDYSTLETEIDKNGWRIIRKYNSEADRYLFHTMFDYSELYETYYDAKKWIDDYKAELTRQSNLSDIEWSLEQIEKTVNRAVALNYLDYDVRKEKHDLLMNYFKSLKNIEDIEVRLYSAKCLQYKHWKNKKWVNISIEW